MSHGAEDHPLSRRRGKWCGISMTFFQQEDWKMKNLLWPPKVESLVAVVMWVSGKAFERESVYTFGKKAFVYWYKTVEI